MFLSDENVFFFFFFFHQRSYCVLCFMRGCSSKPFPRYPIDQNIDNHHFHSNIRLSAPSHLSLIRLRSITLIVSCMAVQRLNTLLSKKKKKKKDCSVSTFLANCKKTCVRRRRRRRRRRKRGTAAAAAAALQHNRASAHIYDPVMKWIYGALVGSVRKVTLVCRLKSLNAFPYLDLS